MTDWVYTVARTVTDVQRDQISRLANEFITNNQQYHGIEIVVLRSGAWPGVLETHGAQYEPDAVINKLRDELLRITDEVVKGELK